ncbi:DUF2497 domain-containing protein [Alteriqipengyuania lutimaris]|uniref:DUF2497 domain-containing protein n=1 Tax=Alteriqipengyuania lutimaris TaxID=1538146 RepID=A0A395LI59_9SPHN|nr:DUF2497 domain-containing protein [Alteriqipengyuania lutimaris]MBB3034458.1 hypothetical protein [Alteriqipengyuania lutimaris]RDS76648.1 DUF2497 domain-containing protein [Alteriqipengyuania lutimaris]
MRDGEASVEEILDSIKKVIARDNRASALEARRRRERNTPKSQDSVQDEEADEVFDLAEADQVDSDDECTGEREADSLLSATARDSMRDNLATLALLAEPGASPQIVRSGETSLEGLVREMLRPMLAEWLDANLPPMVEDMVRQEIERIVKKQG